MAVCPAGAAAAGNGWSGLGALDVLDDGPLAPVRTWARNPREPAQWEARSPFVPFGKDAQGIPTLGTCYIDPEDDAFRMLVEVRPRGEAASQTASHVGELTRDGIRAYPPSVALSGLVAGVEYDVWLAGEDRLGSRSAWVHLTAAAPFVYTP